MNRIRVIPVIMLDGAKAVITRKFNNPIYVGDPINAIKILNDKEVDELIIVDITDKRKRSSPDFDLIEKMASESFMPVAYGGHIRKVEDAERLVKSGVEKLSFNTALFHQPELIRALSHQFGKQSIIASIDIKKNWVGRYAIKTENAQKQIGTNLESIISRIMDLGVGEVLLNSIDKDGTLSGYDCDLIKQVANSIKVPLIACGGASSIDDFVKAIVIGGASAVAAGAMFFFKGSFDAVLINYPDQNSLITHFYNQIDS